MHFSRILPILLAALVACASNSDEVTRTECERLREHLIDLRMDSISEDREQHRASLARVTGEAFVTSCVEKTSAVSLRCALAASDPHDLTKCLDSSPL